MVDVASQMSWWLWTFSWIIMFIPSNFCITFSFTNVTQTTRTIPFIDNTRFGNKDRIFLLFHVITILKLLLVNLWNFFKKCFDLISFSSQKGVSTSMKGFVISNKVNYKTFISTFFTLLKFINYTVDEMQWVIRLHKRFLYQIHFFTRPFIRSISLSKFDDILFERWSSSLIVFRL